MKLGLVALVLLVIGLGVMFLISLTPQRVTLNYNSLPGAVVKILKVDSAEDLHDLTDTSKTGKEIEKKVTSREAIFLQKGAYVIAVSGNNIEKRQYPLVVEKETKRDIDITYSRAHLDTLITAIEPEIVASLKRILPTLESSYQVRPGELYRSGDWYTARLRYIGQDKSNRDTLKVIMKKNDKNTWELVTKTPEIIVTYPKYPDVPRDIVEAINSDEVIKTTPTE